MLLEAKIFDCIYVVVIMKLYSELNGLYVLSTPCLILINFNPGTGATTLCTTGSAHCSARPCLSINFVQVYVVVKCYTVVSKKIKCNVEYSFLTYLIISFRS